MVEKKVKDTEKDANTAYMKKRQLILQYLPMFGWKIAPAAREAGYSPAYARGALQHRLKRDTWFQDQLARKEALYIGSEEDRAGKVDNKHVDFMNRENLSVNEWCKLAELFYKRHGLLKQGQAGESNERERELTDAERQANRRLALQMLKAKQDSTLGAAG
ncbi:MAG: hypothetical protein GY938_04895 [Ketobacter sp.]|nr:hypothetical protein [Ketobacter sp.]